MLPINSVIFKKLLEFKKQGFTYLTSADTGNYTGYDTALPCLGFLSYPGLRFAFSLAH